MVGKRLIVPPDKSLHPSESALLWHAENVYRRHRISLTPLPNNRTSCLWIPPYRVTGSDPSVTDYILEQPAKCPKCRRDVLEKTLVEPEGTDPLFYSELNS
jgi:hypothetical protein